MFQPKFSIMLKRQLHIFFNSLLFFTRISCPNWVDTSPEYAKKSIQYFALVGALVGGIGGLVYYAANIIFPETIAVLLSMVATIYVTGAFHEDGFADVCDGLGGGWNKEKILGIMKDSQIGVFGAVGILLVLGLKFSCLIALPTEQIPIILVGGHSVSRLMAAILVFTHSYVSPSVTSKSEAEANEMSLSLMLFNIVFGVLPLFLFSTYWIFILLVPCYLGKCFLGMKFTKWIGGITGDCAGATQQFCEIIFYLGCVVLWQFI